MSRCFPYPPPGFVSNRAAGDALIQSIKIEREKDKFKHERKEQKRREKEGRKREKKEKKREKKKLKSVRNLDGCNKRKRDADGLDKSVDESCVNSKEVHLQKKKELETEQLERSSLSEEHGQPVLTESLSYSSDGTQSKTKRSRIEQPPSNGNCTTQGKVFRFRLNPREPDNAQPTDDIPATSGRTGTPVTEMFNALPVKDEPCVVAAIPVPDEDLKDAHGSSDILPSCSLSVEKAQEKPKSAYETLLGEWLPPLIQFEAVAGNAADEQWLLFPSKQQFARHDKGNCKAYDGVSGRPSSSLWPHARLLPEADLYALPFSVPF